MATKALVEIPRVFSRSVEINYSWGSSGREFRLEPAYGFTYYKKAPTEIGPIIQGKAPLCGDHSLTVLLQIGPMWYPFSSCVNADAYDIWTPTHYCTMFHEGVPRNDYRGCGPDSYLPLIFGDGNIAACASDYLYGYAEMGPSFFTGYANVVPSVNSTYYAAMEWALPPFGNSSREYVERFFSTDNIDYVSSTGGGMVFTYGWMPKVIDNSDFNMTFNSTGYGANSGNFSEVSQMNFIKKIAADDNDLSETIDYTRRRFDDVFDIRKEPRVAYPPPAVEDDVYSTPFRCFYSFKEIDGDLSIIWAWQEKWMDLERATSGEPLEFLSLFYPNYQFDMYKKEHRIIPEEGSHVITYTGPTIEDGELKKYPSVRIDAGVERFFEIRYSDYDSSEVDWMDSDSSGEVSPDDPEPSFYSKTQGADWLDYGNALYDSGSISFSALEGEALTDALEDSGNVIKLSYDKLTEIWNRKFYLRGLSSIITKDRLCFLPIDYLEWECDDVELSTTDYSLGSIIDKQVVYRFVMIDKGCPSKITFYGNKGVGFVKEDGLNKMVKICIPSIVVSVGEDDVEVGNRTSRLPSKFEERSRQSVSYSIDLDLNVYPDRMIDQVEEITVTVTPVEGYSFHLTTMPTFEKAVYKDKATETVCVWERKYITSVGPTGDFNPNGSDRKIVPRFGFENGGIYWPIWGSDAGKLNARDKMRSVVGGNYYDSAVSLSRTNILSKEEEYQKEIYDTAYNMDNGDYKIYNHIIPPALNDFFNGLGIYVSGYLSSVFICNVNKFAWKNLSITLDYQSIEKWQPKGHVFKWPDYVIGIKCYEIGGTWPIFKATFRHMHTGSDEEPSNRFLAWAGWSRYGYIMGKPISDMKKKMSRNTAVDFVTKLVL
jgi:hypothetical protein